MDLQDLAEQLPGFPGNLDLARMAETLARGSGEPLADGLFEVIRDQYSGTMSPAEWQDLEEWLKDTKRLKDGWAGQLGDRLLDDSSSVLSIGGQPHAVVDYFEDYRVVQIGEGEEARPEDVYLVVHVPDSDSMDRPEITAACGSVEEVYDEVELLLKHDLGALIREADAVTTIWAGIPNDRLWKALDGILGESMEAWTEAFRLCAESRAWVKTEYVIMKATQMLERDDDAAVRRIVERALGGDRFEGPDVPNGAFESLRAAYWAYWDASPFLWYDV